MTAKATVDKGYCTWTLLGGVWTAENFCKAGYSCSSSSGVTISGGKPTAPDAAFRAALAAKGVTLPSSQTTYDMPCE